MIIQEPRIGEAKEIIIPSRSIFQNPEITNGFYLGKHPIETPTYQKLKFLEGHPFIVFRGENYNLHCQRTKKLNLTFWCDGDGDPAYPVGIDVGFPEDIKLHPYQLEFIKNKIQEVGKKNEN